MSSLNLRIGEQLNCQQRDEESHVTSVAPQSIIGSDVDFDEQHENSAQEGSEEDEIPVLDTVDDPVRQQQVPNEDGSMAEESCILALATLRNFSPEVDKPCDPEETHSTDGSMSSGATVPNSSPVVSSSRLKRKRSVSLGVEEREVARHSMMSVEELI